MTSVRSTHSTSTATNPRESAINTGPKTDDAPSFPDIRPLAGDAAPKFGSKEYDDYVIDVRTRAAEAIVKEDWSDDIVDSSWKRAALVDRKTEALEVVKEAAATLSPEAQEKIADLTKELEALYDDLDGWYGLGSQEDKDAERASEIEHELETIVWSGK